MERDSPHQRHGGFQRFLHPLPLGQGRSRERFDGVWRPTHRGGADHPGIVPSAGEALTLLGRMVQSLPGDCTIE
jgi:hypothetical protein